MPSPEPYPRYADLPVHETLGLRHAWGVFGADDQVGRINLPTPAVVAAAAAEVRTGTVINVCLPATLPTRPPYDPDAGGRREYRHTILTTVTGNQDDYLDGFYLQGSTQWDGLRHVRAPGLGFYNGVTDGAVTGSDLGIEKWAERGIVGRGVLVDVGRWLAAQGRPLVLHDATPIIVSDLRATLEHQGVELRAGDILMLRTGYAEAYRDATPEQRLRDFDTDPHTPGLAAGVDMAEFLWDSGAAAVVADNLAVESWPVDPEAGFLHVHLIALLGFAIGEYFDLGALGAHCAAQRRYTCLFTAAPLNIPGGVGSPGNALAIM